jgi:hypothetical protein
MSVPEAKVPTARILVVGVCGIGVLNCGFSPSVCSATVTSLFRRCVARCTHPAMKHRGSPMLLRARPLKVDLTCSPSPRRMMGWTAPSRHDRYLRLLPFSRAQTFDFDHWRIRDRFVRSFQVRSPRLGAGCLLMESSSRGAVGRLSTPYGAQCRSRFEPNAICALRRGAEHAEPMSVGVCGEEGQTEVFRDRIL